ARTAKWFRLVLATAQITLSMALLVMAGLFTRSLMNISRIDLGLQVDRLVTFSIAPQLNGYKPDQTRAFFISAEEKLAALPGVTDVTASTVALLAGNNYGSNVSVQGFQGGPDVDTHANFNQIGPGYFRTTGVAMRAGREFTDADVLGAPKVAIVNEAFVKKFNLGNDAVGKFMAQGTGNAVKLEVQIVGVAKNAKYSEVKDAVPAVFFLPYRQDPQLGYATFYVRTARDAADALKAIPGVIAQLDPNLPVADL